VTALASLESLVSSTASASLVFALEGIEEGAVDAGMPTGTVRAFVRQAILGSALLMQDLRDSPAALKDRVASPGGTTIAGLVALEDVGARGVLMRGIQQGIKGPVEGRDR
jgi:pyrroline-5-carboxylate reductase